MKKYMLAALLFFSVSYTMMDDSDLINNDIFIPEMIDIAQSFHDEFCNIMRLNIENFANHLQDYPHVYRGLDPEKLDFKVRRFIRLRDSQESNLFHIAKQYAQCAQLSPYHRNHYQYIIGKPLVEGNYKDTYENLLEKISRDLPRNFFSTTARSVNLDARPEIYKIFTTMDAELLREE